MKKFYAIALLSLLLTPVFAVDFGGTVGDTTKFSMENFTKNGLKQQNNLSLWAKIPFTNNGLTYLATEGTFMYQFNSTDLSDPGVGIHNLILDLPLLKFSHFQKFSPTSNLQFNAGRFFVTDLSGYVFLQNSDGAMVQFNSQRFSASAYAGYTGLQNALIVTELNAPASTYAYKNELATLYDFSSPYLVAAVGLGSPYLFLNQSVNAEFLTAIGTKGPNPTADNTGFNRFYGTLTLNGPLLGRLFYTLSSTVNYETLLNTTTNATDTKIGNLSSFSMNYYFGYMAATVGGNVIYASPDFRGITSNTATLAAGDPEYNSLIKASLYASCKPISSLYLSFNTAAVFNAPDKTTGEFGYDGIQFALSTRYQIFTDMQVGLSASQYLATKENKNKTIITATAVISF